MPCESTSVTLWYDLQGHPTGKMKFNCSEGGCEGVLKCRPVENGRVFFCSCVVVNEDGSYSHATRNPPPNRHSPCEGNIMILERTKVDGDRTIVELIPDCPGHCDDNPGTHCKVVSTEQIEPVWDKDGSVTIVVMKTYKCQCK